MATCCIYANTAEETFGSLLTSFSGWGASYAESLGIGIQNGASGVQTAVTTLASNCATTIQASQPSWFEAGGYLVDGMVAGIEAKRATAIAAATALASAMSAAVSVELDINSPSGVFEDFGMYSVLGLVNGLDKYAYLAERSAADLADETSNGMSVVVGQIADALNGDMDLTPTIRPVVDLTDVEKGAKLATKTLGIQTGLRVSGITARVSAVSTSVANKNAPAATNTSEKVSQTTNYNYTQNNYSPKSLSRLDIYRQT